MDFGFQPDTEVGRRVMANVQAVIHEFHPFVKVLKTAIQRSIEEDIPDLAVVISSDMKPKHAHKGMSHAAFPVQYSCLRTVTLKGRYNKPEVAQICAVIPGADIDDPKKYNRDIVLFCQDNAQVQRFNFNNDSGMTRINELHPGYDTAQYPVMLPHGSYTWKPYGYALEHHKDAVEFDDEKEADSDPGESDESASCEEEEDCFENVSSDSEAEDVELVVVDKASESEQETAIESSDESEEEVSDDAEVSDDDLDWVDAGTCTVCFA